MAEFNTCVCITCLPVYVFLQQFTSFQTSLYSTILPLNIISGETVSTVKLCNKQILISELAVKCPLCLWCMAALVS
jgi:hypothetical protein